jgi:hypothetical protein
MHLLSEYSVDTGMIHVFGDRLEYFFSHLPILGIIVQVGMGESNDKNQGMQSSPFRKPSCIKFFWAFLKSPSA